MKNKKFRQLDRQLSGELDVQADKPLVDPISKSIIISFVFLLLFVASLKFVSMVKNGDIVLPRFEKKNIVLQPEKIPVEASQITEKETIKEATKEKIRETAQAVQNTGNVGNANVIDTFLLDSNKEKINVQVVFSNVAEQESKPGEEIALSPKTKAVVTLEKTPVSKIEFESVTKDTVQNLRVDEVSKLKDDEIKPVETYAIDPTSVEFTSATVTVPKARGNKLMKCKEWDFENQVCNGDWTTLQSIVPGQEYSFDLTQDDPGFAEINATNAEHLDENHLFISDIFAEIEQKDNVWSEPIPETHFVRVAFERKLRNENVIDVYARSTDGAHFEIYEIGKNPQLLGTSSSFSSDGSWEHIQLQNLHSPKSEFDFKIINGTIEFDYIHDATAISDKAAVAVNDTAVVSGQELNATAYWQITGSGSSITFNAFLTDDNKTIDMTTGGKDFYCKGVAKVQCSTGCTCTPQANCSIATTLTTAGETMNASFYLIASGNAEALPSNSRLKARGTSGTYTLISSRVAISAPAAPVITAVNKSGLRQGTAVINWTTDSISNTSVRYGKDAHITSKASGANSVITTSHNITLTGLRANQLYYFNVTSCKNSICAWSGPSTFTTRANVSVSALNKSGIRQGTVVINWTTNLAANTSVRYGKDKHITTRRTIADASAVTIHNVTITGLRAGQLYYFNISSGYLDSTQLNGSFSFTTRANVSISASTNRTTTLTAVINWTTNVAANTSVRYGKDKHLTSTRTVADASAVTSHNVTLIGLRDGTKYYYNISSGYLDDEQLNGSFAFITTANMSIKASTNRTRQGTAVINWTTNLVGNTSVNYGIDAHLGTKRTVTADSVTSHNMTLTGLKAGTKYYFNISSCTLAGNCMLNNSPSFKLITKSNVTISAKNHSGITQSVAFINWTTNVASNTSINYGKDTHLGTKHSLQNSVTSHNVTLTGLVAGTKYYYNITSSYLDSTEFNGSFSFTTRANVSISASTNRTRQGTAVINWTTNINANTSVNYGKDTHLGTKRAIQNAVTSHNVTLFDLVAGTKYYYNITSTSFEDSQLNGSFALITKSNVSTSALSNRTTHSTVIINWTTNVNANTSVNYGKDTHLGTKRSLQNSVTSHNVTLFDLRAGQLYYYNLTSSYLDSTEFNGSFSFTTVINLSISAINKSGQTSSSAVINWTTDLASNSTVKYGKDAHLGTKVSNTNLVTIHNLTLSGLDASTTYYFNVSSCAASTNCKENGSLTFITKSGVVTTCDCPGLGVNWEIDMTEGCDIKSPCNIGTGVLSFKNAGHMHCGAAITTTKSLGTLASDQIIWVDAACVLKTG